MIIWLVIYGWCNNFSKELLVLTILNEGAYLTFKLIAKSRSNPFLEPTITKAIRVKFLAHRNNGGFWWGSKPTTSTLRVRRATHCARPPLEVLVSYMRLVSNGIYLTRVSNNYVCGIYNSYYHCYYTHDVQFWGIYDKI